MTSAPIPLDALLAHREWVRAVARAVVRDPNAADDVEQETWLAAMRSPPRHAGSIRGWLGAVVRSRARRIGRTDARREARELAASRDEATASAAEIAEIADAHRRVVQAVVELDEPYRATILLRYFEGLSVDGVAARTGAPVETTRARIKRGVAKLRERLSRELGTDERPWALAFVPLIGGSKSSGAVAATGGGVVMASTTKTTAAVVAAVLLVGLGAVLVPKWTAPSESVVANVPAERAATPKPVERNPERVAPRPTRERAAEVSATPVEPTKPRAPAETVPERLAKAMLSVDWKDAKLLDVFGEIAARTGVEIVVSTESVEVWRQNHVEQIDRLSLDQDVRASQILDLVTRLTATQWTVEEPRVVIVPQGVTRDPSKPVVVPPKWTPSATLTVIGRVIDATGAIVVGAEVVRVSGGSEKVVATTDIAGRYEVKLPKPFGSLEAHAPGQQPSFAVGVDGQLDAQVTVDLATRGAAGTVVVRLITDPGPIPNVLVIVGAVEDTKTTLADGTKVVQRGRHAYTNEQAVVTFAGIAPGRTTVSVHDSRYEAESREVEVVAGRKSEVEFRLAPRPSPEESLAKQRVSFNFRDARAADVVKYLNTAKGLSIVMDPALAARLDDRTVTLAVSDRPLDESLRALCHEIGDVTYVVQGPVIFIRAEKR